MSCWLDVLLVECIRIVSSLFNTSKSERVSEYFIYPRIVE